MVVIKNLLSAKGIHHGEYVEYVYMKFTGSDYITAVYNCRRVEYNCQSLSLSA